jgi:uncharacterized protein (TIGR02246 family)
MGKDASSDIEAIEAMSKARAQAFNEGDAKAIAEYFTEDAILMAPGAEPKVGPKEVEAYYQSTFDLYETRLTSYYDEVEVSGDLAFGRGTAEVTLIPKNGDSTLFSVSKYLNILQKQPNGEWKTTHDIWNDNP